MEVKSKLIDVKMKHEIRDALRMAGMEAAYWHDQGGILCWRRNRPDGPEVLRIKSRKHLYLDVFTRRHFITFEPVQPMSRRGYEKFIEDVESTLRKNLAMSKT